MARRHLSKRVIIGTILLALLAGSACSPAPRGRPTLTPSPIPTETPWPTQTPTPTPRPSSTPTLTPTFTPYASQQASATPTFTATAIPPYRAVLFPLVSSYKTVDWGYRLVTREERREDQSLREAAGMLSLRLLDRGIHRMTAKVMGKELTLYYLRVSHAFDGQEVELKLILTGYFGKDVPLPQLPADGALYLSLHRSEKAALIDLPALYQTWTLPLARREPTFRSVNLTDFELILANLPESVILLAGHPVAWSGDDLPKMQDNMRKFSAYAARFSPFFRMDSFGNLLGPSDLAAAWQAYFLQGLPIPLDMRDENLAFSADYLILVTP